MPRIVGWKEFCSLPNGTVFSEYEPHIVNCLLIRDDVIYLDIGGEPIDYFYTNLEAESASPDSELEVCVMQRDGTFDYGLFVVYDAEDVRKITQALLGSLRILDGVKHGS